MPAPTPILLTVDIVVSNITDRGKILLIKRKNAPFQGQWALPGGFVDPGETTEAAARRELVEETGIDTKNRGGPILVGVYSEPGRDPRGPVVSVAYRYWVGQAEADSAKAADDAAELTWMTPEDALKQQLAFDHNQILLNAIK